MNLDSVLVVRRREDPSIFDVSGILDAPRDIVGGKYYVAEHTNTKIVLTRRAVRTWGAWVKDLALVGLIAVSLLFSGVFTYKMGLHHQKEAMCDDLEQGRYTSAMNVAGCLIKKKEKPNGL